MNSGFRPLPAEMPFLRKADCMVRRGEVRTFSEAVKKLRPKRAAPKPAPEPREIRLPYVD